MYKILLMMAVALVAIGAGLALILTGGIIRRFQRSTSTFEFTEEDDKLLCTGSHEDLSAFLELERVMHIDWRSDEEETIEQAIRFLPENVLVFEQKFFDDATEVRLKYLDREDRILLQYRPQNNFRIIIRLRELLQPDYDLKLFAFNVGDDDNYFLLRPTSWWTAYRASYPRACHKHFLDVTALTDIWNLDTTEPATPH